MPTTEILDQMQFLPQRLAGHIFLSFVALLLGGLISLPLGIWCSRRKYAQWVTLTSASVIQTIPSLALLAAMVFAWGRIGWVPALIALVLYSLLPILRNTIAGIQSVDPACLEAAQGLGMSGMQRLRLVELPLAAPTIVAGIRTAAVWVVGAATLAQPVGATSLGNYIFAGLQTLNPVALGVGCFFSAALALSIDGLLGLLELAVRKRSGALGAGAAVGLTAIVLSPFLFSFLSLTAVGGEPAAERDAIDTAQFAQRTYVLGGKGFTEQRILTKVLQDELRQVGRQVELKEGIGSAVIFRALETGQIDCYVDYSGTLWANVMRRDDFVSSPEMLIDLATRLKAKHHVISLGALGFSNDYVFVMKREKAAELQIRTLDDLAKHADGLNAVTDIEFWERPEWARVREVYRFDFKKKRSMDATLMYGAIASDNADVVVAFRTDGRIAANDLVEIADPARALPPYDAVLLVSQRMVEDAVAVDQLRKLINAISTEEMRNANRSVDIDGGSISAAAAMIMPQR
ncbi:MAG: ABC transporter permease/substrate-binding protein [Blastopirellula sp. JB062]